MVLQTRGVVCHSETGHCGVCRFWGLTEAQVVAILTTHSVRSSHFLLKCFNGGGILSLSSLALIDLHISFPSDIEIYVACGNHFCQVVLFNVSIWYISVLHFKLYIDTL